MILKRTNIQYIRIYLFLCAVVLYLNVCAKVTEPLELELQILVSCHVGAGN